MYPSGSFEPKNSSAKRVLIMSHSHPQLSNGGAEVAAHYLYKQLQCHPDFSSWFLGCTRDSCISKLGARFIQPFSDSEYIYTVSSFDWFKFSNLDPVFPEEFRMLLSELRPDIVHFHHYINFGVEAILHVRKVLPDCKIIVTLHEYLAICHHFGQMVTKQNQNLCSKSTDIKCTRCFPNFSPSDFFLRKLYIQRFFDLVDHFISPSSFLADRYIDWGIPAEKMSVIENLTSPSKQQIKPINFLHNGILRIGFFGQISVLKGINVLLDAAYILEETSEYRIVFEIHGDYSNQPIEFQEDFISRLDRAGRNVIYRGVYDQDSVDSLMQSVDFVIVPSIWWENSPVVIQEALRNNKPILCSGIGGMKEKVTNGIDGFHFPVGDALSLVSILRNVVDDQKNYRLLIPKLHDKTDGLTLMDSIIKIYNT